MSTITLRLPDSKHERLKQYAKDQGISLNKLFDEFATVALAQFDAETRYVLSSEKGDTKKGDVLGIARIAGIMAAKKTPDLIPLCHPLALTHIEIELQTQDHPPAVLCLATVATDGKTGVEMEALNETQVALLTIYDMCKAVDRGMVIESVRLLKKSGGKSSDWSVT